MNWYKKAQSNPAPFLETPEKAWEWAKENVDIQVTEDSVEKDNIPDEYLLEKYIENCYTYSDKYNDIKNSPSVTIYRAIRVNTPSDINWNNVGTHWSFEKSGAGVYGELPRGLGKNTQDIVLTAIVEPKHIDWEYCFTSFMYYGEDQWECSLDEDAPITVTQINDQNVQPINAKA